jgi:epoxyqueuosine reductase
MDITQEITKIANSCFFDLIGFADLRSYRKEIVAHGGPIVEGFDHGISLAVRIPDSIVDFLPSRSDPNVACVYRKHGYEVINSRLDYAASLISSFLNQQGYRTLPIPAAERTNQAEAIPTVSHKMIAHIAGLGWIGKNCLLITPEYGPRIRLISLLTKAPVAGIDRMAEQECRSCTACVDACPAGAIKGRAYVAHEEREARLDFRKCQGYFEELRETMVHPVCGMCLYACPRGRKGT